MANEALVKARSGNSAVAASARRRAAAARFCVRVAATACQCGIRCCSGTFERGDILRGGELLKLLLTGLPVSLQLVGSCAQFARQIEQCRQPGPISPAVGRGRGSACLSNAVATARFRRCTPADSSSCRARPEPGQYARRRPVHWSAQPLFPRHRHRLQLRCASTRPSAATPLL